MSNRQDYTAYTEVDTGSKLSVIASMISATGLLDNSIAYVYKDFGASYFAEDFEHTFSFTYTASTTAAVYLWGLSNTVESIGASITGGRAHMAVYIAENSICMKSCIARDPVGSGSILSANTRYWCRVCRDEASGSTYGTMYLYVYTDSNMTNLLIALSDNIFTAKVDYRYLFAISGKSDGSGSLTFSGSIKELTLDTHAYTQENIITNCRSLLNEATASFWTDAELLRYINDAERDIAITSGCIQKIDTVTTTNATRLVAFSGYKVVAVEYVPTTGRPTYLMKITPKQLGHFTPASTYPERWFESGTNIGIDPLPNSTYTLRLYLVDYPSLEMSVNTQIPCIPPVFHSQIIQYVLYRALLKDKKIGAATQQFSIYRNDLLFNTMDKLYTIPDGYENMGAL